MAGILMGFLLLSSQVYVCLESVSEGDSTITAFIFLPAS